MEMIDTLKLFKELKDYMTPEAAEKIAQTIGTVYEELRESVTKKDFAELQATVQRIVEIQEQSEKHLAAIDLRLEEITETQRQTDQRLEKLTERMDQLTIRMDQLAEAQRQTDQRLEKLTERMDQLAEAQRQTDQRLEKLTDRVDQLTVRMDQLTERVDQLAKAQLRTEEEIARLSRELKGVNKRLGGLSMTVGYGLEDKILLFIPAFARDAYGMEVTTVDRRNLEYSETEYDEINIYAEGRINGELCYIVGECKAQPGKRDADRFARKLTRAGKMLKGRIFPLLVGYVFPPQVERYIRSTYPEIHLLKSFEFEMKYSDQINKN
jgi:predicted nuclease with TOPRIM domain